jgi:hypothetical protein
MESNYLNSDNKNTYKTNSETSRSFVTSKMSQIEKDSYEPIEYEDSKNEEAIFDIFLAPDYKEIMSNIVQSIDNYYQENENYDDYPYFRVQNTNKYVPKLKTPSEIFSERQLRELHANLPYHNQYKNLKLLYSTSRDGYYLKTFYSKAERNMNTILVIKDDSNNVFGAYVSEEYKCNPHGFYGTGETFLFTYFKTERIHCFHSSGLNDYYVYSDEQILSLGCSDNYFSISLEKDFLSGYSRPTQTFKNPCLSSKEDFFVSKLELWGFEDN